MAKIMTNDGVKPAKTQFFKNN